MSNAVLRGGMGKRHLLALPRRQIKGKEKGVLRKKSVDLGRHRGRKNVREKMSSVSE